MDTDRVYWLNVLRQGASSSLPGLISSIDMNSHQVFLWSIQTSIFYNEKLNCIVLKNAFFLSFILVFKVEQKVLFDEMILCYVVTVSACNVQYLYSLHSSHASYNEHLPIKILTGKIHSRVTTSLIYIRTSMTERLLHSILLEVILIYQINRKILSKVIHFLEIT